MVYKKSLALIDLILIILRDLRRVYSFSYLASIFLFFYPEERALYYVSEKSNRNSNFSFYFIILRLFCTLLSSPSPYEDTRDTTRITYFEPSVQAGRIGLVS
jgi:dolichol kinase